MAVRSTQKGSAGVFGRNQDPSIDDGLRLGAALIQCFRDGASTDALQALLKNDFGVSNPKVLRGPLRTLVENAPAKHRQTLVLANDIITALTSRKSAALAKLQKEQGVSEKKPSKAEYQSAKTTDVDGYESAKTQAKPGADNFATQKDWQQTLATNIFRSLAHFENPRLGKKTCAQARRLVAAETPKILASVGTRSFEETVLAMRTLRRDAQLLQLKYRYDWEPRGDVPAEVEPDQIHAAEVLAEAKGIKLSWGDVIEIAKKATLARELQTR